MWDLALKKKKKKRCGLIGAESSGNVSVIVLFSFPTPTLSSPSKNNDRPTRSYPSSHHLFFSSPLFSLAVACCIFLGSFRFILDAFLLERRIPRLISGQVSRLIMINYKKAAAAFFKCTYLHCRAHLLRCLSLRCILATRVTLKDSFSFPFSSRTLSKHALQKWLGSSSEFQRWAQVFLYLSFCNNVVPVANNIFKISWGSK